jgi:hypothetical protein
MYKQSEFGGVIVIRLVIYFGELVKVALKGRVGKRVGGGRGYRTAGLLWPLCVCECIFLLWWRVCVSGTAGD